MAQYPIPQFIEEEAKIVFFLTFRQFFLLVGGGVASFALYYTLPFYLFVTFSIFIMMVVSAIAFLKIDDEPVIKKILHFINFHTDDKNYIWKNEDPSYLSKVVNAKPEPAEKKGEQMSQDNKNTKEYTYLKSSLTAPVSKEITNTKTSRLNAAKKAIEFKNK